MIDPIQTYPTEAAAIDQIDRLRGWAVVAAEQMYYPDDDAADTDGNVWIIAIGGGKALRESGLVA